MINETSLRYYGWRILGVSVLGMILSPGPMIWGTLGLVAAGMRQEFGWSRPEIMFSLTFVTVASIPSIPLVGRLIDRSGVKRVLIPSIAIFGALIALTPLLVSGLWTLYFLFFLIGVLTPGTQSVSYINILSNWFDKKRGLVIGICASGLGLGYMLLPALTHWMASAGGWRSVYYMMSALVLFVSLPAMLLVVRDAPGLKAGGGRMETKPAAKRGLSVMEAVKTPAFWLIISAIFVFSFVLNGMLPNIAPMLMDRGMSPQAAAVAASIMGTAMFIGRLGVGYLIDIYFAPRVAIVVFFVATLGLGILATGAVGGSAWVAAFLIGLGFGAETDLMGFLVTRYFGLKCFGQIYGLMLAAFLTGTGLGPYVASLGYATHGAYIPALTAYFIAGLLALSLFFFLRPYPEFNKPGLQG